MADDAGLINEVLAETSFLYGGNAAFVEDLYAKWAANPESVEPSWRAFFASLADRADEVKAAARKPAWAKPAAPQARPDWLSAIDGLWPAVEAKVGKAIADKKPAASQDEVRAATLDSLRAIMMIRAYRMRGHLKANLDPLQIATTPGDASELDPASYGFAEADFDRPIFLDYVLGLETATLREIIEILRRTYCGNVGVQYMHISDPKEKAWLQERIEGRDKEIAFTKEGKIAILKKLIEAQGFEAFLHRRFPGTKRFGLDGGEAMVPALEQIIKRGGAMGVKDLIVGMPHRGRLNVLAAVMGKPYHVIFHEFQGGSSVPSDIEGSGDVKYHLGASSDREFDGNSVHLSLTANPSHLEIVNPVVIGKARAKQAFTLREQQDAGRSHVLPLLLHGDAAFAGQGVVAECFALSGLKGYGVGGTMHFVVNNQIGFTTSPKNSRSSPYPSDVALMVEAPIFHVNGDDPEAVTFAAKVATEYRQLFGKDVVVDMFCYRRFGHNEGDDPTMTQPLMYAKIKGHPSVRDLYAQRLVAEGVASQAEIDGWVSEFDQFLDAEFEAGKTYKPNKADWLDGKWSGRKPSGEEKYATGVPKQKLLDLGRKITSIPERVSVHKTVERVIGGRREAIESGSGIDWATAEHLAFATLLDQGYPVRLSGQDSVRGTFSHRHAGVIDQKSEEVYFPLRNLGPGQAHFEVLDSALSEEAVLGFEYGFSLTDPDTLTLWEAQFGDFVNGAQVVIDQFISSGERKWLRMSGLVMLLPHGYEGQGPEHSSARLERFLQLCAEDNMQVVNCTTPANYFHVLRRQLLRDFRKPLIVMSPKSLLRHKRAVSNLTDMAEGTGFHRVMIDGAEAGCDVGGIRLQADDKISRVIVCSGKVYFDLVEQRAKTGRDDIYILRLEQFYPWPLKSLTNELKRFKNAELVWCQEEPKNMGGWQFVDPWLELTLERMNVKSKRARYVGRPASASTAAGLMSRHLKELEAFLTEAFA
ncbi:2-oxoglutarate dehydrogenase E1 component [Phenylobacterium sp. J426]|uniref:2-oxoglutarate dehydrogenase E1 component n=1 Tax=Phenylobacterium sp. J426 TaxID=2898439 RepID=UPI002151D5FB|nr:2-oxoglutarate dehydrogenase E1 component [Phenylobacterium sp. J426]MCR5873748.1 2-oxoglutarate dehydrogenase E1 component [Phenylobacterium sp. J426]